MAPERTRLDLTPQERERRRQAAINAHAAGRFGGAAFGRLGGRPRLPRLSELIAEELATEAHTIARALLDGMAESESPADRSKAAARAAQVIARSDVIAQRSEIADRQQIAAVDSMSDEELSAELTDVVLRRLVSGRLPELAAEHGFTDADLAQARRELEAADAVVDAQVVEEIPTPSQEHDA